MADQQEPNEKPQASSDKSPPPPAAKDRTGTSIGRIFAAPFVAVGRLVRGKTKIDEIVVYSAPPAFFLWIVIATGLLLRLVCPNILTAQAGAWIFIFVLVYIVIKNPAVGMWFLSLPARLISGIGNFFIGIGLSYGAP